ncbi:hypothetical protein A2313_04485 [Candidatus Roizmanbacteria bacterium RIFOXYB2_FULL_41_10]|uniref:Aminotransferase DegT n=1 Tax=Candidatus Roizmanbacteria bacterium RIFOXYA1_FULL_41_12 TaxID=1802082 RepID=A0A1F7K251_9BACT|nr:MAG: hypothetical protein A2209_04990 [Candidatus Roizmanbacteria bacterium RIFOXYA1_FULL_41_12]OGK66237.1 MAG: hypothetical protein A2262_02310 [Candidatus Roizmanbacteria bacterium RIFOXYA2_FULL_41_8]OGK66912.1 MAG: hypothetical protein A2377_03370 [Candidatus Roizmanbacteria bacterium RIFOXYB1_FULL_41_27]OGK70715.1 MAG: hypothetical protein A2403_01335 [Candidatus Roizmanbacteria bacterium RIFOXYC1_FULL_41_16]OGK71585.1 MAG: hypothetical protein A2313_04485 [Candidatus Roizmanbacteria bac
MINHQILLSKPIIDKHEEKAVLSVLRSGQLVQGPQVKKLEIKFSKLVGAKYALAVNNGTSALHTALQAVGIGLNDEVITTPFTFVATANSILMTGAKPVFVDIDPLTFNLDPNKIEAKINKSTKAILVVDLYGQPASYLEIIKLAKKHNLLVIADAAQSIGSSYKSNPTGCIADITTFSLYATKNITSIEGGMVTTKNRNYYKIAKLFRHHGQDEEKRYFYSGLGFNYRLTDLQAAIALTQLNRLKKITLKRQQNAHFYNRQLVNIKGIITPYQAPKTVHVYHQYTLRITEEAGFTRDQLQHYLAKKGVQTNIYYPMPLYRFSYLSTKTNLKDFPNTELASRQVLSIPVHPLLTKTERQFIVKMIKSYAQAS